MNRFTKLFIINIFFICIATHLYSQGGIVSFYKVGIFKIPISQVAKNVKNALINSDFNILGEYKPGNDTSKYVIAFSRKDLMDIALGAKNRGALAGALRIGIIDDGNGNVEVSLLNPQYLFYGYLRDNTAKFEIELNQINLDVIAALSELGVIVPYITSSLSERQLKEYRFMLRNPGFADPIVIRDFNTFEEGVKKISDNLKARKGRTFKVYQIIDIDKQIAVFGVGLWDEKNGETDFLNQLGASHLAALPYEIILSGKQASILHGKFRFPFYWSDISMNKYTKIYRTPREIQEVMSGLTN